MGQDLLARSLREGNVSRSVDVGVIAKLDVHYNGPVVVVEPIAPVNLYPIYQLSSFIHWNHTRPVFTYMGTIFKTSQVALTELFNQSVNITFGENAGKLFTVTITPKRIRRSGSDDVKQQRAYDRQWDRQHVDMCL